MPQCNGWITGLPSDAIRNLEKSGWEPKKPAVPSQKFFLLGRLEWIASSVMGKFVF